MAIDSYMVFIDSQGKPLMAESQVTLAGEGATKGGSEPLAQKMGPGGSGSLQSYVTNKQLFEVEDYSFDVEQTLNLGSQSSGTGAGRITFNPFSITRKIDQSSPIFYIMACNGTSFKFVHLLLRKSTGGGSAGQIFLRFDFRLVAVKTLSWAHDDESPKETVTFEYGALGVRYRKQNPDGTLDSTPFEKSWNKVRNIEDTADDVAGKDVLGS